MMRKLKIGVIVVIIGTILVFSMNYFVDFQIERKMSKVNNHQDLANFIEMVLPEDARGKVKIQSNPKNPEEKVLAAVFKIRENIRPKQVIEEFLVWSSKVIEKRELNNIKSIRIVVYHNKDLKRYYVVLGKNKLDILKKENYFRLLTGQTCLNSEPNDLENFCIFSNNF